MKATHFGHCQACGSRQKMPGGVLALHGYTTRWGFFSGICPGSKHNPFETHTDLIEKFAADAAASAAALRAEADALDAPATEPSGWFEQYIPATWQDRQSQRIWKQVELVADADGRASFVYDKVVSVGGNRREEKGVVGRPNVYGVDTRDLLATATAMNRSRAAYLRNEAKKRDEYVAWQTARVAAWKPEALVAVA